MTTATRDYPAIKAAVDDVIFTEGGHGPMEHCLMQVTEVRRFSVHATLWTPNEGLISYRATHDSFRICGKIPDINDDAHAQYVAQARARSAVRNDVIKTVLPLGHPLQNCLMLITDKNLHGVWAWMQPAGEKAILFQIQPEEFIIVGHLEHPPTPQ